MFKSWTWRPLEGLLPSKRDPGKNPRPFCQVRIQWEVSNPERTLTQPCQHRDLTLPASRPASHNLTIHELLSLWYSVITAERIKAGSKTTAASSLFSLWFSLSCSFGRSQLTDCELYCGEAYREWRVTKAFSPTTLKELDPASRPGRTPEGQPFSLHSRWLQPRGTQRARGT